MLRRRARRPPERRQIKTGGPGPASGDPAGRLPRGARRGIYLHFPYCLSKCSYCDFASRPLAAPGELERYTRALEAEIRLRAQGCADTLFLGGGTPSLFSSEHLRRIFSTLADRVAWAPHPEITLEINPATADDARFRAWKRLGINRLSLGVQSTQDAQLRVLGRRHNAAEARQTLAEARRAGFDNISCDLMYGLPGQTLEDFQGGLAELVSWRPEHLSLYALSLEPGTPLAEALEREPGKKPDEDLAAEMYAWARVWLPRQGFFQYELSNFAKPGRSCRHNRLYWEYKPYLGLGAAAHSFLGGRRSWNEPDPETYCKRLEAGRKPVAGFEKISGQSKIAERLMLGLRLTQGVSKAAFQRAYGPFWRRPFASALQKSSQAGWLEENDQRCWLTGEGMLMSNAVFRELL